MIKRITIKRIRSNDKTIKKIIIDNQCERKQRMPILLLLFMFMVPTESGGMSIDMETIRYKQQKLKKKQDKIKKDNR